MDKNPSFQIAPKQEQFQKQQQLLMMLPQMQQGIAILQLPIMELSSLISEEIEKNPLLEESPLSQETSEIEQEEIVEKEIDFTERDFEIFNHLDEQYQEHFAQSGNSIARNSQEDKLKSFVENSICQKVSLFSHLMKQAEQSFESTTDLSLAESIIGNLDANGFLTTSLSELAILSSSTIEELKPVLEVIQTFDPPGIASEDIRNCLLNQLKQRNQRHSIAYQIVDRFYSDLVHNRIPVIQKKLSTSFEEINEGILQIAKLDLRPGANFSSSSVQALTADAHIRQQGETLVVEINEEWTPTFRLNKRYMRLLSKDTLSKETRAYILHHLNLAKWLFRNLFQRSETLLRILNYIIDKQKPFFLSTEGNLTSMTMKEIANELELHESTIARAVANKHVSTPRGLLPLRYFFSSNYVNIAGDDISAHTVREAIKELIEKESKDNPLSDEGISSKLKEIGIICARRTVAKHRNSLNLGTSQQRRQY